MSISDFGGRAAFDSETTRLLGEAFEAAWRKAEIADRPAAEKAQTAAARELLARRIIELGRRGERNHERLVEGALDYLARSSAHAGSL